MQNNSTGSEESRFPDFGPCNIEDWKEFLIKAKVKFLEKWKKPIPPKDTLDDYDQLSLLGSGSFGEVILVKHKDNGNYFAMKAIEKKKVVKARQLEHLKNEKKVLQCIDFPLAVYLLSSFIDNSYIYFIMPFITGGELFVHLRKFGSFEEAQARFYVCQVILALEYLHYFDLIYRDLKPENILIDHTGYLKLTDFGFCKRLVNARTYTLCGTPEYLAPEVILSKGYGISVDWWAIGVLTFELVVGISPFFASNQMKIYEKIVGLKYKVPTFFSSELKDLVKNLLQIDLTRRYGNLKNGVDDIKSHKWFKSINWLAIANRKVEPSFKPKYKNPGDTRNFETSRKWKPLKPSDENKYGDQFADF